jgi:ABC-type branched-subunit amino acid transport system ATPase component
VRAAYIHVTVCVQVLLAVPKHAAAAVEGKPANAKKMFYVLDALRVLKAQKAEALSSAVQPMLAAATTAEQAFHRLMGTLRPALSLPSHQGWGL